MKPYLFRSYLNDGTSITTYVLSSSEQSARIWLSVYAPQIAEMAEVYPADLFSLFPLVDEQA